MITRILLIILTIELFIVALIYNFSFISETLLFLTALIIFWYTFETYKIRKYNQELLYRSKQPIIGYALRLNPDNVFDVGFNLINQSDYQISCLVYFNIRIIDIKVENLWPAYSGKKYWNLQYKQMKYGHFSWLDLFSISGIYSTKEVIGMKKSEAFDVSDYIIRTLTNKFHLDKPPKININVEIFCFNKFKNIAYYPTSHYTLNIQRLLLIADLVSDKPYWKYDSIPDWVDYDKIFKEV